MSTFSDCIVQSIKDGKIRQQTGDKLVKNYENLVKFYQENGNTPEGARAAAEKSIRDMQAFTADKKRNLQKHLLKREAIVEQLINTQGFTVSEKVGKLYQSVADAGQAIYRSAEAFLDLEGDALEISLLGTTRDYELVNNAFRIMMGNESITDPRAITLATAFRKTYDFLHAKARAADAIIGRLDNYFPQIHVRKLIAPLKGETLEVKKAQWINFISGKLNMEKMKSRLTGTSFKSKKELDEALGEVYDNIVFAGRKGTGGGDIDARYASPRFLFFKDDISFFEYNNRYGVGENGLIEAYFHSLKRMSQDIGALEVMGPKPGAMANFLDGLILKDEVSRGGTFTKNKRDYRMQQFNIATNRVDPGDSDHWLFQGIANTMNILRSSMLGSAPVSALSDVPLMRATARVNGLKPMRQLKFYITALAPGDAQSTRIARRMSFTMRVVNAQVLDGSRFAGQGGGILGKGRVGQITASLARLTNTVSGLDRMSRAGKAGMTVEAGLTLGEVLLDKKSWDSLGRLKNSLSDAAITKSDYDFFLKHGELLEDAESGAMFFSPTEFRAKNFRTKDLEQGIRIAGKLDTWIEKLRREALNDPSLATRFFTTGGGAAPGTLRRAAGGAVGLFKSFPITVFMNHFLGTINRFRAGDISGALEQVFNTMILTTIFGAGAIQTKNIIKGKTLQDWDKVDFWLAAALQGGGLGILGDFVFGGGQSRFGRKPFEDAAGPLAALVADSLNTAAEIPDFLKGERSNIGRNLAKMGRSFVPTIGSLWYTRLVFDRLFADHVERLLDPQYDSRVRRHERDIERRKGQEFWWRPGEFQPR